MTSNARGTRVATVTLEKQSGPSAAAPTGQPRYDAIPGTKNMLLRTEPNGQRTIGRIVGRSFVPVPQPTDP